MHAQHQPHYSDQTLSALVESRKWTAGPRNEEGVLLSVERTFAGRIFTAGYGDDPIRRRYIALKQGENFVVDVDGRGKNPADVAFTITAAAFDHMLTFPAKSSQHAKT